MKARAKHSLTVSNEKPRLCGAFLYRGAEI